MPNIFELIAYAVINYIPYMILGLVPFATSLRYSKVNTAVIFYSFSAIIISMFIQGYYLGYPYNIASTHLITLTSIVFYFLCVKSRWGRMLFNLFMIKNVANFVVVVAKYLEGQFFPDSVGTLYHWTNSLCVLIVMIPVAPIIVYIVHNYFSKQIRDAINPTIWRFLWLIPVYFYVIWLFAFYYSSSESSLELALKPKASVFMVFFLSGQLLIYVCISKLVIHFNKEALLEEENRHLSEQYLQYQCIQDHIQEISRIKHDLRHHLVTLSNYADNEEYTELKEYLNKYINTVPNQKISYCGNAALNMILVYYAQRCQDECIYFKVSLSIPTNIVLSDSDITVLFGNLLENAVDACNEITDVSERFISLTGKVFQNQLIFVIENAFINDFIIDDNGSVRSTKHNGYGIGTTSAKNIVNNYAGTIQISPKEHIFSVSIFFPFS